MIDDIRDTIEYAKDVAYRNYVKEYVCRVFDPSTSMYAFYFGNIKIPQLHYNGAGIPLEDDPWRHRDNIPIDELPEYLIGWYYKKREEQNNELVNRLVKTWEDMIHIDIPENFTLEDWNAGKGQKVIDIRDIIVALLEEINKR